MTTRRANGTGSLYRRGKVWWLKYHHAGRAIYESSHTDKEGKAQKLLTLRLAAVMEGRAPDPDAARLTLTDLRRLIEQDYRAQERKSWPRAARAFDAIAAHFGATRKAATVKPRHLQQYLAARLDAGAARATVQKELAALRRSYTLAVRQELLTHGPKFPALGEIKNARCVFIEEWEWALVRPNLPAWWQDMGDAALATGWRVRAELRSLAWADVDQDNGTLTLKRYATKNGDGRAFPYREAPPVAAAIARRLAATREAEQATGQPVPWVFHVDGQPVSDHAFYATWRRAWRAAFGKEATPKRPHDFRRSGVRNLEAAGISRNTAMKLVGHRTESMYRRYAITTLDDLRDAVRKVNQPAAPPAAEPAER